MDTVLRPPVADTAVGRQFAAQGCFLAKGLVVVPAHNVQQHSAAWLRATTSPRLPRGFSYVIEMPLSVGAFVLLRRRVVDGRKPLPHAPRR